MGQGAKTDFQKCACHFPWQPHSLLGKLGSASPQLARWTVTGVRHWQVPAKDNGLLINVGGAKTQKTSLEDVLLNTCVLLTTL